MGTDNKTQNQTTETKAKSAKKRKPKNSNVVTLKSGLEIPLNLEGQVLYKKGVPQADCVKVDNALSKLNAEDLKDLLEQVGATKVKLTDSCHYADLSFLPEGVVFLDHGNCSNDGIASLFGYPKSLKTFLFGRAGTVSLPVLLGVLDMVSHGIHANGYMEYVVMPNGFKKTINLSFERGAAQTTKNMSFCNINTEEDLKSCRTFLQAIGRYMSGKSITFEDCVYALSPEELPLSVKTVVYQNCPALDLSVNITQKSALKSIEVSNVHSISSFIVAEDLNPLDSVELIDIPTLAITPQMRVKNMEVRDCNLQGIALASCVEKLKIRGLQEFPTIETAEGHEPTISLNLAPITLDELKDILNLPYKVNLSLDELSLGAGVTVDMNIRVENSEVTSHNNEIEVTGLEKASQLEELEKIVKYFPMKSLKIYSSPVVTSIGQVDFGVPKLMLRYCTSLKGVNETLSAESNLVTLTLYYCGGIQRLNTSKVQNLECLDILTDETVIVTPSMHAYELKLRGRNLVIESKESFAPHIRKLHMARYMGIDARANYDKVDAPTELLAKMPDYVQHNLKESIWSVAVCKGKQIAEGVKRVPWVEVSKRLALATKAKLESYQLTSHLMNKVAALPLIPRKTQDGEKENLSVTFGDKELFSVRFESYDTRQQRLNALEDKSKANKPSEEKVNPPGDE